VVGVAAASALLIGSAMVLCAEPRPGPQSPPRDLQSPYHYPRAMLSHHPTDEEIDEQIQRLQAMKGHNAGQHSKA
jgi:hypothetical protein